jgi:hypothetical protein
MMRSLVTDLGTTYEQIRGLVSSCVDLTTCLTIHIGRVGLERNEYVSRGDVVLFCETEDNVIRQEGRII